MGIYVNCCPNLDRVSNLLGVFNMTTFVICFSKINLINLNTDIYDLSFIINKSS